MMRLDPSPFTTARARTMRIFHGGGENNVIVGLAGTFRMRAGSFTALVDDGIGRNIEVQMREAGVDTNNFIWFNNEGKDGKFCTDGKGTLHNGVNFTYAGKGLLPAVTEYYRAHTPIREVGPGDVDWESIFGAQGVRWFHTGGIYTLLSEKSAKACKEALVCAGKHGTIRSFDLNYRSKVQPDKSIARAINKDICHHIDFAVGNHEDFEDAMGYKVTRTRTRALTRTRTQTPPPNPNINPHCKRAASGRPRDCARLQRDRPPSPPSSVAPQGQGR
jgi:2-dehydro-3-deoxygluconokinase